MKRKTTLVFAMTLVIAGLLITSAAGLSSIGQPANKEKKFDSADSIAAALRVNPGQIKALKTAVRKELNFEVQKVEKDMQTKIVEQSRDDVVSSEPLDLSVGGMRQPYDSFATHPACADDADGSILLGYQYQYRNYSNPPDFDAFDSVIWEGTNDYGDTWGDGLYWVDDTTGEPIAYTYPSADFWGESISDGGDQYFATQVDVDHPDDPGFEGTHVSIMRVNPDVTDEMSYAMRTWTAFADTHRDMTMADIACSDGLHFPANTSQEPWGLSTYVMDNDHTPATPWDDNAHFFYPVEYQGSNGYALMSWWLDSQYCTGTCAYIDDVTKAGYGVWDPVDSVDQQRYFLAMNIVDMNVGFDYPEPDENTVAIGWSLTDVNLGLQHPVIAANDGAVVAAMEITNATNPNEIMISFWYQPNENGSVYLDIAETWYIDEPGGEKIQFPEISHVIDNTFICTMIYNNEQLLAITEDGGATWEGLYYWSGDETVIEDYRANELSDDGAISVWEYDDSSGGDSIINLYYSFNTVRLEGNVIYEDGDPVVPLTVDILNTNNSKSYPPEITGNFYTRTLMVGFDVWSLPEPSPFNITASDDLVPFNEIVIQHEFTEINNVNTIDITLIILGDCDHNGNVTQSDLGLLLAAYGSSIGDPNYNPNADFDNDGDVDQSDLGVLLAHYGQRA